MKSIELMIDEHKFIKRMLVVVRKICLEILHGKPIDYNDFKLVIEFIRGYADAHHHGKEEQLLFNQMVKHLGSAAEKLVNHGMLVEHDLGRLQILELEKALSRVEKGDEESKIDVISYAMGYANLLNRHIDKEDNVVYPFAERLFKSEISEKIDLDCIAFEHKQTLNKIQDKYIGYLMALESKY